jgi:PAS domain-containing protein
MSVLRQYFLPPSLDDEHERNFVNSFLRGILLFSIIITILIIIGLGIYGSSSLPMEIIISGTVLLMGELLAFLFCWLNHPRIASVMFITLAWAYVSYTILAFGGLANPVSGTMIIVLLIAGTLLGQFGIVLMSGLALISSLGVAYLWMNGLMPEPLLVLSPIQAWIIYFSNILAGGVIMLLWYRNIQKAMQLARQEVLEREMAETALRASELRYRQAIMAANAVPYALDYANNTYTFMGEEIAKILGFSSEELTPDIFDSHIQETILRGDLEGKNWDQANELIRSDELNYLVWRGDLRMTTKSGDAGLQMPRFKSLI